MRTDFQLSSLVPSGLVFEDVSDSADSFILIVRSVETTAACPLCGGFSRRVHSRYVRRVADLPLAGREVQLRLVARRFLCEVQHCARRIFAERFGDTLSRSERGERRVWNVSFITWGWLSVEGRLNALPSGSGCLSATTHCYTSSADERLCPPSL